MLKKAYGLAMGAVLVAMFSGYATGCNSTSSSDAIVACYQPRSVLPAYAPPLHFAGLCSAAQLSAFVSACLDLNTASNPTCGAFIVAAGNETCVNNCLYILQRNPNPTPDGSDAHAANFGAMVEEYGAAFVNEPGYFALIGGSAACASAYYDTFNCSGAACANCSASDGSDQQCATQAVSGSGACVAKYNNYSNVCAAEQALITQAHNDVLNSPLTVVTAFCGSLSIDGGTDSGTDSGADSGNTDAGDGGSSDAGDASTDH